MELTAYLHHFHFLCKENIDIEFLKVQQQITAHLIIRVRKMESGHVTMAILIALHCFQSDFKDFFFFSALVHLFNFHQFSAVWQYPAFLPSMYLVIARRTDPAKYIERGGVKRERVRKRSK